MELSHTPQRRQDEVVDGDALANDGVLPTDVLGRILLHLPAKFLCRLRLVCRSWRSLTSDQVFLRAHASRHPLIAGLHKNMLEIHVVDLRRDVVVRQVPVPMHCVDLTTQRDVVCATLCWELPISFVLEKGQHEVSAVPEKVGSSCAFPSILGYVPSTGEYKVLHFLLYSGERVCVQTCHVMTLEDGGHGRWREAAPCPAEPVWPASGNRAVIDGVAYFLMYPDCVNSPGDLEPDSIASFDLAAEIWRPTPLRGPVSTGGNKLSYYEHRGDFQLTELGGSLVILHCKYKDCSMSIWFLMDKDNVTWCKRYTVQCAPDLDYRFNVYPIVILDDGQIVMWTKELKGMRAYDPRTRTWTTVMGTTGVYISVGTYSLSVLR